IRDLYVTGVQTCALPISEIVPDYSLSINEVFVKASTALAISGAGKLILLLGGIGWARCQPNLPSWAIDWTCLPPIYPRGGASIRSEERRVGKGWITIRRR